MSFLDDLRNLLDDLRNLGLCIEKESHPGKPYHQHVKECYDVASGLLELLGYNPSSSFAKLVLLFCTFHDVGKLLPTWHYSKRGRPYHAVEGAEWLLREGQRLGLDAELNRLLAYIVMTHHTPLLVPVLLTDHIKAAKKRNGYFRNYEKCRELIENVNQLINNLNENERYELVDMIGILKLADMMSARGIPAENVLNQYRWFDFGTKIREAIVRKAVEAKGQLDRSKLERQEAVASCEARHLLVAAPTGWGKTAVAQLRTAYLKPTKIFYILPTITAIKKLYETFRNGLGENYVGEYFYFADFDLLSRDVVNAEEPYPFDFYRYFIPKLILTTIDQLLYMMLQVGKYHVRRFNLRKALIVIDEFHLLTPQMVAALRVLYRNLARHYGLSLLLMSATPSPFYGRLFLEAIPDLKQVVLEDEYRRLKRHKIAVTDKRVEEFVSENEELIREKRSLIVVNTISRAQRVYKLLKEIIGNRKIINLIHSEFAYRDREEKEELIERTDILVSTQIAEVSLDVSFDILVSELAPIPAIVQRLGRVNRYGQRAEGINAYICRAEGDRPYGSLLLKHAEEALNLLIEGLEREGEAVYLSERLWEHEQYIISEEEVRNIEKCLQSNLSLMYHFYSFLAAEEKVSEMLGREKTLLALPKLYLEEARKIFKNIKEEKDYEKRIKRYAELKSLLVPVAWSNIRSVEWDDFLKIPVIQNYDRELGFLKGKI